MTPRTELRVTSAFVEEPRQDAYRCLIDALQPYARTFLLVARERLKISRDGQAVFDRLLPFRLRSVRAQEWPGTRLTRHFAQVCHYPAIPETGEILKTAVDALYEWKQPKRPEDLCFLDGTGEPILTLIAHEKMGWVTLPRTLLHELKKRVGSRFFGEPR